MEFIQAILLKVRNACAAFGKYYLVCTGVITLISMVFFGVLLPSILVLFVSSSRSKEIKRFPIHLFDVYILGFVIVLGMKIVCQPIMSFFLRSSFPCCHLASVLKVSRAWNNATIGWVILELVLASIIPQWFLFDAIFRLGHAYMIYLLLKYFKKVLTQVNGILDREGIAAWA